MPANEVELIVQSHIEKSLGCCHKIREPGKGRRSLRSEISEMHTPAIADMGQIGIVTELRVSAVLTKSVSPHARRAVREAQELPKGISSDLATVHARRPFPGCGANSDQRIG